MKNNFFIILITFLQIESAFSENLLIQAKNISIDKKNNLTIFTDDVVAKDKDKNGYMIKSQYAEFDNSSKNLIAKNKVSGVDSKNNLIVTEFAEYNELTKIFKTKGSTKVKTSENYIVNGKDIVFDDDKKIIKSNEKAIITDADSNKIYLDSFEYQIDKNIFKSIGYVKIQDKNKNSYEFGQIYIDTKKKEILGTDSKLYLNQDNFKVDIRNKPRIFSNTSKISEKSSEFQKSVFTFCDYRENDKCPPWSIQSEKLLHDNKKKNNLL